PYAIDFIEASRYANPSIGTCLQAFQSSELFPRLASGVGRVQRLGQTDLVAVFRDYQVVHGRVLRPHEHRKQSADETPIYGTRQIEMAIGRTSQEVNAVRSVFLQALDGVVVPIKDPEHRSRSAPSLPTLRHHTSTIWRGDGPTWVERPFNEKFPERTLIAKPGVNLARHKRIGCP